MKKQSVLPLKWLMTEINCVMRWTDKKVYLAPMAGITDLPFRQICRQFGDVMVTGEMVSSDLALSASQKSLLRRRPSRQETRPIVQIVGWDAAMMADAARFHVDQGASVIDINMGCPAKKVCRKSAGSALLADETLVAKILSTVVAAVSVPVTVKIRTGIEPSSRNGVRIATIAEQSGVSQIAVHGRTRQCKFYGEAEYETIKEIKQAVSIPVLANGDIDSFEKAQAVLAYSGADGVMIGRATNGRPWFAGQLLKWLHNDNIVEQLTLEQQRDVVLQHLELIYQFYGAEMGVRIARKHIKWYVNCVSDKLKIDSQVNQTTCPRRQRVIVSDYYYSLQDFIQAA